MPDSEEAERRIRKVDMLRKTVHRLRAAQREAYDRGEFPYPPPYDVRTDLEYWQRLADEQGITFEAGPVP